MASKHRNKMQETTEIGERLTPKEVVEDKRSFEDLLFAEDMEFVDTFRLTRKTVRILVTDLKASGYRPSGRGGVEKWLLLVLWYLGKVDWSLEKAAIAFALEGGAAGAAEVVRDVCVALATLLPELAGLAWATEEEMSDTEMNLVRSDLMGALLTGHVSPAERGGFKGCVWDIREGSKSGLGDFVNYRDIEIVGRIVRLETYQYLTFWLNPTVQFQHVSVLGRHLQLELREVLWEEEAGDDRNRYKFPRLFGLLGFFLFIPELPPSPSPSSGDQSAVALQAVVDDRYRFRDVYATVVESKEKASARQVLLNSPLCSKVIEPRKDKRNILAGSIYPQWGCLLTPYIDDGNLMEDELWFNCLHGRVMEGVLQETFTMLVTRFPRLGNIALPPEDCVMVIRAAAVLHNYSQMYHDMLPAPSE
ncbi:hypothetical protein AAG570_007330 [Ranatra chinensis]|uniref:DDE Tnp4 domain-containing protein n=1 Tax=Ranatra chinensis TaxID=642074 RepID=A0ABD0XVJ9_9HEMI